MHHNRYLSHAAGTTEQAFELLVVITIERHARTEIRRHLLRKEAVAFSAIDAEALQVVVGIEEAESVAVGKRRRACDIERVAAQFLDTSDILAQCLGRVGRKDVWLAAMQEVSGKTTVEGLVQVGTEGVGALSARGTAVSVGMLADDSVERLAIGRSDILHVSGILQATFNLERRRTGIDEFLQVAAQVHIFQREQVTLVFQFAAIGIDEVELHAAELCAGTAVGRTTEAVFGSVAQAAIADTQRAMNEDFELDIGHGLVDGSNLVGREFAGKNHTAKAHVT